MTTPTHDIIFTVRALPSMGPRSNTVGPEKDALDRLSTYLREWFAAADNPAVAGGVARGIVFFTTLWLSHHAYGGNPIDQAELDKLIDTVRRIGTEGARRTTEAEPFSVVVPQ